MIELISDLILFCKKPFTTVNDKVLLFKTKLLHMLLLLTLNFILIFPFFCFLFINKNYIPANTYTHTSTETKIFFSLIFAPIIEEIVFRFPLQKAKWSYYFLICIFFVCTVLLLNKTIIYFDITIFVIILILMLVFKFMDLPEKLVKFWHNNYTYLFYFITLIFGAIHLTNFSLYPLDNLWILPVLFIPQTICGFLFGYIRLKYGMIWCILQHSLYNTVVFCIDNFTTLF